MKRTLFVTLVLAVGLTGCNWLKTLGKKDNVVPPHPLVELTPTVHIDRVWSESVGHGAGQSGVRLTPAVIDGRLYAGSTDGTLVAMDANTGHSLWRKQNKDGHWSFLHKGNEGLRWSGGPAVSGDLVVAGTLDGEIYAYSAKDGTERWHAAVAAEVIAAPVIAGDKIIVRTNDGRVYSFSASDGSRQWISDQSVPALSLRGNGTPLVAEGLIYAGFDNGKVVAIRLDDGVLVWAQTISSGEGRTEVDRLSDVDGDLVLDGGTLFAAGHRGQLVALSPDSGRPFWARDLSSYAGVGVSSNAAVVTDIEGNVWAFDRQNGANLWKQDGLKHRWLTTPAIQGNYIVVGDLEGYVHWLSLEDGKLVARERLSKKPIEGTPTVVSDVVYVEDIAGHIGAFRLKP